MKTTIYISYLCIFILAGCSVVHIKHGKNILNDALEVSYQDNENSLKAKRTSLLFNNGGTVTNCNSYFLLNSKLKLNESNYNQQVKSEYLICDALDLLSSSARVNNNKVNSVSFGKELLSKLDLRSFPSSLKN